MNRHAHLGCSFVLGLVSLSLSAVFAWQTGLWMEQGWWARIAPIADYPARETARHSESHATLHGLVEASGFDVPVSADFASILRVQRWLGDQVAVVGDGGGSGNSEMAWNAMMAGKGLACGEMAMLFQSLLETGGVEARVVQLYRSNFEPGDTHVVVEARVDGRWVAFDPTFNLTFHGEDGRQLGVAEIRSQLAANPRRPVGIAYHGERRYPAHFEDYDIDGLVLYANAFVHGGCSGCAVWERLPPFRYWLGPVRFMFGDAPDVLVSQHNRLYFTITVVFPLLIALFGGAAIRVYLSGRVR